MKKLIVFDLDGTLTESNFPLDDGICSEDFTANEKGKIIGALQQVVGASGFAAEKVWGENIEDRDSQITYSALGQQAPIQEKKKRDPGFATRKAMKARLDQLIPKYSVHFGGTTSVDVPKPGIDKAFGIRKLRGTLGVSIEEMIFIGDALFPGGNDYPAEKAGAYPIRVRDPEASNCVIEATAACL
jgi:hydroxymethylpyrimidine pyrophosphatase-like HAD family hydrolase